MPVSWRPIPAIDIATLSSESDSNTFTGEETEKSFVILFFQSHYGHISRLSESMSAGAREL